MQALNTAQIWVRFAQASLLATLLCLPIAFVLLKTTGVPSTYPPLLPQQIIAGTVGGALLVTLGYWLLTTLVRDPKNLAVIFVFAGIVLLIASFYLPYRLSFTKSPRFAGVTLAAQIGQGFLHSLVVGSGLFCFLRR